MITSADPWFRGIDLASGPDGGVYILDWSDIGECHERDGIHRTSGRIFKVLYGHPQPLPPFDLGTASDAALVAHLGDGEEWFSRMARQVLQGRAAAGVLGAGVRERLSAQLADGPLRNRLRALWALHATGGGSTNRLIALLGDPEEALRIWAIRLLSDDWPLRTDSSSSPPVASLPPGLGAALRACAEGETSPRVRLALASCLQRLPLGERAAIVRPLLAHGEDAGDHNLPLMLWFGIKDLAETHAEDLARLACGSRIPLIARFVARRFGEDAESRPAALDCLLVLASHGSGVLQAAIINGLGEALAGWRRCAKPVSWDAFRAALVVHVAADADPTILERCSHLDTLFGSGQALTELIQVALDQTRPTALRRTALKAVIDSRPAELRTLCETLLEDQEINDEAVRGLALFDDPAIAQALIKRYRSGFHNEMRPAVIAALVSRPSFARVLLDRIGDGPDQIPRSALSAFDVRQLRACGDAGLNRQLTQVWGVQRDSPTALADEIRAWTATLTPAALAAGNRNQGRQVFVQVCSLCHRLYGEGGTLGPDLTGSGRSNLAFLLESIVDPSAVVAADFRYVMATLSDGRVVTGVIKARSPRTLTIQSMTGVEIIEQGQITQLNELAQSPMPEGLLRSLSQTQVIDLIAYLMGPDQVPLP